VRRILREKFRLGLFDHPFVDADAALAIVGTPEFRAAGVAAQRASLTLLKNEPADGRPVLPLPAGTKVYLSGVSPVLAAGYAEVTDDPAAADVAVVRLDQPAETGGRGSFEQRFHGGTLDFPAEAVEAFAALAARLPTVAVVRLERPLVLPPVAAAAAALVGDFGASDRALLNVLFGRAEPKGRLPFDLPSSMREVLDQKSDVPFDMPNPAYRFGFGLSYPASHPAPDPRPQGNDN
jgi:beta-glucosidase